MAIFYKSSNKNKQKLIVLKRLILFTFVLHCLSLGAMGQDITISGKVINDKGEPVSHATIVQKGTVPVYTTNDTGEFLLHSSLPAPILIISSVGYETLEYKIQGKQFPLSIKLTTNVKELKEVEVVSTGYQDNIPRERATGSFYKIDNVTLNQQAGTNILRRLDGVSSGLLFNIGKTNNSNTKNITNITIRGLSSINGPLDPLIVLDNFIYEGDINNINPNDVESITLLKDAAAASVWGARAGNGVIVITTKKGKFNQPLQVGFNTNIIIAGKPDLFYLPQMSSSDYINVEQFLFNNGYFDGQVNNVYQPLTPAVSIFLKRKKGLITSSDSAAQIEQLKNTDIRNEYNRHFYRNPVIQQYNLNIRGGSSNNIYSFSVGYDKGVNETYNSFNKLNVRVDNTYKPFQNFQINLGAYFTNSVAKSGRQQSYNTISIGGRQVPYLNFETPDGALASIGTILNEEYTDTVGAGKLLDWKYYPLDDYKHDILKNYLQEIFTNISLQYKLKRFFSFDIKYQFQKQQSESEHLNDKQSFAARNTINLFSQLNSNTGVVNYMVPAGGIRTLNNSITESQTGRAQANFAYSTKSHSISAIMGAEMRQVKNYGDNSTLYGYSSDPLNYTSVDFINLYPTLVTGNYQGIPGSPGAFMDVQKFVSLYGVFSYTYRNKYTMSASARKDGSNIFGSATNDRWKPLWSTGASWKLSEETFYRSSVIPVLKLRATYGYSGNIDLSKSAIAIGRYFNGNTFGIPYTRIQTLNNPDLRWEQTGILNIGIDFGLRDNIFSGSIEYYIKEGTDLYGDAAYDYTTWGFTRELVRNVANMEGHGVDIIFNSKNIDKDFKWNTSLLLSYNSNKTTKYDNEASRNIITKLGNGNTISPVIGKPMYAIVAYRWGGLDAQGNPQGYLNGQLSTDYQAIQDEAINKGVNGNLVYKGSASPLVFGSLINSFSWKKFSLAINISYRFHYYFQKSTISYSSLIQSGNGHKDYERRWEKPGDELTTNIPSFIYPNNENRDNFFQNSEINVLKGDHIRLQYINLDYSFQLKKKPAPFTKFSIYANVSNLGILWKANKEGPDPDFPTSIRPARIFAFGIKSNF